MCGPALTMPPTPVEILSDVVRTLLRPYPPATLSLDRPLGRLPHPAASHADGRGLPALAVAALFRHLPVPDLIRLGYIFTPRWRQVWRMEPLCLHDRQFASLLIPRSEVAHAIGNVLEEYLDGVEDEDEGVEENEDIQEEGILPHRRRVTFFRVESTDWLPAHASRWCAALERGFVVEVVLFNRRVDGQRPVLVRVPHRLLACTTVTALHLAYFTVEAGELDALTGVTDLGLHGCSISPGVVEGVVAACSQLKRLSVQDCALESVEVRSAPRLVRLSMLRTFSRRLTVDDAPLLRELLPGSTDTLSISGAPVLSSLMRLNLPGTTLEIDGVQIEVRRQAMQPQMRSVRTLWLALDYTALRGMEVHMVPLVVQRMLMRFPCVNRLTIERKDGVPQQEGMASRHDDQTHGYLTLYGGLDQCLHTLTLFDFRGGKAELALAKAIMDSTHALWTVDLAYSARRMHTELWHATEEAYAGLQLFAILSTNHSLQTRPFGLRHLCTREIEGSNGWCGADLF